MRRTAADAALVVALAVLFGVAVGAGLLAGVGEAAHEEPERTIFGLELAADGDAEVYWVVSFDIDDEDDREVYEEVAANESLQETFREDALEELRGAAANGTAATDREMRIHDATVETYEQEGYGRVEVRADWESLAWADGERVIVTEPFAGGYEPPFDRVAIHGPEGYVRGALQPNPARVQRNSGLWSPGTADFSVFHAEFVVEDAGDDGTGDDGTGDGDDADDADDADDSDAAGTPGDGGLSGLGTFLQALAFALVPVALVLLAGRRLSAG